MKSKPPEIVLNSRCDQKCVFCLAAGRKRRHSPSEIAARLSAGHSQVSFQGGEPLYAPDLAARVAEAKKKGTEVTIFTNGWPLRDKALVKKLIKAGAENFNVNFPAHTEKLHDELTGTEGRLAPKIAAVKNLLSEKKCRVVFTFVVNSLNFRIFPAYAAFVAKEFPGIFYVNVYFIIARGAAARRKYLVPRLSDCSPHIRAGLRKARSIGLRCMVDGIPLCHLKGLEEYSADTARIILGRHVDLYEKTKAPVCSRCSLSAFCAGVRRDYAGIHGFSGLFPSRANPRKILKKCLVYSGRTWD